MSHDIRVYAIKHHEKAKRGFQARCMSCKYDGPLRRTDIQARQDAIAHKHIADNYTRGGSNWAGLHRRGNG